MDNGNFRNMELGYMPREYRYRNLACTDVPRDSQCKSWCVQGEDSCGGSGVLEWCYSRDDARCRLDDMLDYPQFKNLTVGKF